MLERFETFSLAISEISKYWHKLTTDEMEKYGLKGPHSIYLLVMAKHEEGLTAPQICELCGKDKADVSRTMSVMEQKGLVTKEGEGEELKSNGSVAFYYAGYVFSSGINSSNLFSTNHQETAASAGWTLTDEDDDILTINLESYELIPGLKSGLEGVKTGEECQILFSGKYGFGKKGVGIVPANSALVYKIWVESISNE